MIWETHTVPLKEVYLKNYAMQIRKTTHSCFDQDLDVFQMNVISIFYANRPILFSSLRGIQNTSIQNIALYYDIGRWKCDVLKHCFGTEIYTYLEGTNLKIYVSVLQNCQFFLLLRMQKSYKKNIVKFTEIIKFVFDLKYWKFCTSYYFVWRKMPSTKQ